MIMDLMGGKVFSVIVNKNIHAIFNKEKYFAFI